MKRIPIILRRRWTPARLGGQVAVWSDARDGVQVASGAATLVPDKSPFARDWSQATAGNRPLWSATGFNGVRPGLTFDGVDDYLSVANIGAIPQPFLIAMAINGYTGGAGNADMYREDATGGPVAYRNGGGASWTLHAGNFFDSATPYDTGPTVHLAYFNGASSILSNTSTEVTGDAGTNGITGGQFNLGLGFNHSTGSVAAMQHAEIVIVQGPVDAELRGRIRAYLAWNSQFQAKLASTDPYRWRAP